MQELNKLVNKQIRRNVVPRSATTKVKVKVTGWHHLKGLVTRIMHAKYQCSIFNTSEDMTKVKVFVTDRRRVIGTDRRTNEI